MTEMMGTVPSVIGNLEILCSPVSDKEGGGWDAEVWINGELFCCHRRTTLLHAIIAATFQIGDAHDPYDD